MLPGIRAIASNLRGTAAGRVQNARRGFQYGAQRGTPASKRPTSSQQSGYDRRENFAASRAPMAFRAGRAVTSLRNTATNVSIAARRARMNIRDGYQLARLNANTPGRLYFGNRLSTSTGVAAGRAANAADAVREYVRGFYRNGEWVKPYYRGN